VKNYGYGSEVDPNLVKLIVRRASLHGFRENDMEDVLQQVFLGLLRFRFDPAKSNGCQETTVLITIIDRRLKTIRRTEARYQARQDNAEPRPELESDLTTQLQVEVRSALEGLSPIQRQICTGLGNGDSTKQIAQQLGCSWHVVERHVAHIRAHFQKLGLDHWFGA